MSAHRSPNRHASGSRRVTPKGTRPPGVVGQRTLRESVAVDHHLDAAPPKRMTGRALPPTAIRQRSGHRGGR